MSKYRPPIHVIGPSIAYIQLSKGFLCLVDSEDADILSRHCWQGKWDRHTKKYRAERHIRLPGGKRKILGMHRQLMNCPDGFQVDHKNINTLDNRKSNLRICTSSQNSQNRSKRTDNTSGFKGVHICMGKYQVQITKNGKRTYLGRYSDLDLARKAYESAAKDLHGEYGRI